MDYKQLYEAALAVAKNAYVPYSQFHVGAALLLPDGTIQTGINIENRSYGATNCAERTAVFSAIEKGYKTFKAIAVATPDADYPVAPCGICRQVLTEFAPEGTAAKEYGTTAAAARQRRLFPFMEHRLGHHSHIRASAVTPLTGCSVCAAASGTQGTLCIIHAVPSFKFDSYSTTAHCKKLP